MAMSRPRKEVIALGEHELLKLRETAQAIGCTEATLRRWINRGHFPGVNLGTVENPRWRVLATDLDQWIQDRRK